MEEEPACHSENKEFSWTCQSCGNGLEIPWIRCAECCPALNLCSRCFCFGVEFGQHESDHAYTVVVSYVNKFYLSNQVLDSRPNKAHSVPQSCPYSFTLKSSCHVP